MLDGQPSTSDNGANLERTSRFHSTQGTPLSSYLRCDRLIEQLLNNLQPKRRAGVPIGKAGPEGC